MTDVPAKPALTLRERWMPHWQKALNAWGFYIRLKDPVFCVNAEEAKREGLSGSFAMIRLDDHSVVISEPGVNAAQVAELPLEILAHEVGHHVYAPADLGDMGRMIARIRRGIPGMEQHAPMVGNLYTDLLINDRLFRVNRLRMDEIYRKMAVPTEDKLWNFYMRIYEILWTQAKGSFAKGDISRDMEGDAALGARLVRNFAGDWLRGSGRFAALCYPYMAGQSDNQLWVQTRKFLDSVDPGAGKDIPDGLAGMDDDELTGSIHPALEEDGEGIGEEDGRNGRRKDITGPPLDARSEGNAASQGNYREPFEYGQILKSLGINLDDRDVAVRYYRERAIPYLIPFPSLERPKVTDPIPEGLSVWDIGEPLENLSWIESATRSPVIIPGYTSFAQVYGDSEGNLPNLEPVDLDLYVDCSGSMPDPATNTSYLTLAGAIVALSALRAGASVQATLWSGVNEFETTKGFVRDEKRILRILCGYFGGGTAFPVHILRKTYLEDEFKRKGKKTHILVISDEGVTTIFENDEKGNSGEQVTREAFEIAGGGGTFLLNLYGDWHDDQQLKLANQIGFDIARVKAWEDLVAFSREFAKKRYGQTREQTK